METYPIIHVVATECQPEVEEKFNKWYDEVHIPLLFKFKGMRQATRYQKLFETKGYPEYLTIYKFESKEAYQAYRDSPELAYSTEEMNQAWKEGGFEVKWRVQYEPIKTWEK